MGNHVNEVREHVVSVVNEVGDAEFPAVDGLVLASAAKPDVVWLDARYLEEPVVDQPSLGASLNGRLILTETD